MKTNIDSSDHSNQRQTLREISLPDDVTEIDSGLFRDYLHLQKVTLPNSVVRIGNEAFSACSNLTDINIPDSVTSIGERSFANCKSLTKLDLPESLNYIGKEAFLGCTGLVEFYIPKSVLSIGDMAFADCVNLKEIYLVNPDVNIGKGAFDNCDYLVIHCPFQSTACEYAISSGIQFLPDVICINQTHYVPTSSPKDISGDGWNWNSEKKILSLDNYDGGSIFAGADLTIELKPSSKNYISKSQTMQDIIGLYSLDGEIKIQGDGKLLIEKCDTGIYANDSIRIASGEVTVVGKLEGLHAENGEISILGGTVYAASLDKTTPYPAINGNIRPNNARIFAGDNQVSPILVNHYTDQKYVCITHDESCNPEFSRIINQVVYNIGENAQVITGNNYGTVIGKDAIINRSKITNLHNDEINDKFSGTIIGDDAIINRSNIMNSHDSMCGEDEPDE